MTQYRNIHLHCRASASLKGRKSGSGGCSSFSLDALTGDPCGPRDVLPCGLLPCDR